MKMILQSGAEIVPLTIHKKYIIFITYSRAYLKANVNLEDALQKSESLLNSTKKANVDQTVISLDLLASVYNKRKEYANEIRCLTNVIELNHSLLPDLWMRLGKSYESLDVVVKDGKFPGSNATFPIFFAKPYQVICCCYVRANILLKTVEATVNEYAKDANTRLQGTLNTTLKNINFQSVISENQLNFIRTEMSKDIFNRYNNTESLKKGKFSNVNEK